MLDARRRDRLVRLRTRLVPALVGLPSSGWPAGVFGRRDAAILMLAALGYRPTSIAQLRRGQIRIDPSGILLIDGTAHDPDPEIGVPHAYLRWAQILDFADRHIVTHRLADFLDHPEKWVTSQGSGSGWASDRHRESPVFVPIDRWGHLGMASHSLTAAAITTLISAHCTGTAAAHAVYSRKPLSDGADTGHEELWQAPRLDDDPGAHDRGVRARHHAQAWLADIHDTLSDVEDRADELLRRTLAILDEPPTPDSTAVDPMRR